MKFKAADAFAFCANYNALEDVALSNKQGFAALDTRAALLPFGEKYELRAKALNKERMAIIRRHSANEKGEIQFKNPAETDESKKLILFRDEVAAQAEFDALGEKYAELEAQEFEADVPLLPKDFFEGIPALVNKVRTSFAPFLARN